MNPPPLPPEHFALQLAFARRVAAVTAMPLADALLQYTICYSATGLRRASGPNPEAPEWQAFLAGFADAADPVAFTYAVYLANIRPQAERTSCFSYRYEEETRTVQMQFANKDPLGSLKRERIAARHAELQAMMTEIAQEHPDAERVVGHSWLYNLEAYRRLFPPAFVATPVPGPGEYDVLSSWGPFLDYRGQLKQDMATAFLDRIAAATTLDELLDAFPYRILSVKCGIEAFYTHYGVAPPDPIDECLAETTP